MLKFGFLFLYAFVGCTFSGKVQATCVLTDAPNQCGAFCLSSQMPLIDHNRRIQAQFDLLSAQGKVTQAKLERIEKIISAMVMPSNGTQGGPTTIPPIPLILIPVGAGEIPPGFELIGSRYLYFEHDLKRSRDDAGDICIRMGGRLADLKDENESVGIGRKLHRHRYWLGINDRENEGQFLTASGRSAPYLPWGPGAPHPDNRNRECVIMSWDNYKIFRRDCEQKHRFICQLGDEI